MSNLRQFDAAARVRLARVCGLLGSAHDGEALNAARAADRLLKECGVSWLDALAAGVPAATVGPHRSKPASGRYEPPLADWPSMARDILRSAFASEWERDFTTNLLDRWQGRTLTRRQASTLSEIWCFCRRADAQVEWPA
jgi:hypothetical protein